MSLINDALKRAKAVQDQTPPPPVPALRPVDVEQRTVREIGLLLPGVLTAIALAGLLFAWQIQKRTVKAKTSSTAAEIQTQGAASATPGSEPQAGAVSPMAADAELVPADPPAEAGAPNSARTETAPIESKGPVAEPAQASATAPPETALPVEIQVVAPIPLRLQAVVYDPQRPTVMINGKTMRVGDRLGDYKLVSIQRSSAVIVSRGQTNVLELPE